MDFRTLLVAQRLRSTPAISAPSAPANGFTVIVS
jgi:hypothetical protein